MGIIYRHKGQGDFKAKSKDIANLHNRATFHKIFPRLERNLWSSLQMVFIRPQIGHSLVLRSTVVGRMRDGKRRK